jgi:hypothetical protein
LGIQPVGVIAIDKQRQGCKCFQDSLHMSFK